MLPDGNLGALFMMTLGAAFLGVSVSIASGSRRWGMTVFVACFALYAVIKAAIHGLLK